MTSDTGASPPDPGGQAGAPPPEATPDPVGAGSAGSLTFTQEQVARLVAEEKRKVAGRFADYDEVKKKLTDLEAAGKTELERAQQAAKDADLARVAALTERDRLLVQSALTSEAVRAGALDPDVVVALLSGAITVSADGSLEGDVKSLVGKLMEDKPFLKNGSSHRGSADQGSHSRHTTPAATPSTAMDSLFRQSRHGG